MLDLDPPARQVAALLDGVAGDQLSARTPCENYSLGDLLDHLMGLTVAFTVAATKSTGPAADELAAESRPGEGSAAHLRPDWRSELPRRLDRMAAAWKDPAAWDGDTEAGGITLPAEVMGGVAVNELVLHGWDLARATAQPFACDQASAQVVFEFTAQSAEPEQLAQREGLFGPVVDVGADEPLLDRALGFAGRDPAWTP